MTPDELAKSGTEHGHQRAFFAWLAKSDHGVWLYTFAIPNGGSRGDDKQTRRIRGGMLKAEGVKAGVPDIFCAIPVGKYHGLFIEMKKPKVGRVQDNQTEWGERLLARGYAHAIAYTWRQAAEVILSYHGVAKDRQATIIG